MTDKTPRTDAIDSYYDEGGQMKLTPEVDKRIDEMVSGLSSNERRYIKEEIIAALNDPVIQAEIWPVEPTDAMEYAWAMELHKTLQMSQYATMRAAHLGGGE